MAYRYTAFLSYSHAVDGKLAPAIQSALHRLGRPWYRLHSAHVFRDKTSLAATPSLWPSIERALGESENFILLASPESVASRWVKQEVEWWLARRPLDTLLIVVTGGTVAWNDDTGDFDWRVTDALGPVFSKRYEDEPLWVDVRWASAEEHLSLHHSQFRAAILDIAAPLLKRPKEMIDGEDIRVYRRNRRAAFAAVVASLTLGILAGAAAFRANQEAIRAAAGEKLARENAALARQETTRATAGEALARENALRANQETQRAIAGETLARENARRARARELAAHAARLKNTDPALALYLGLKTAQMGLPLPPGLESIIAESADNGPSLQVLRDQDSGVVTVDWNPDGTMLASGNASGTICLWAAADGRSLGTLQGHHGIVTSLSWSPDGKILASSGGDQTIRLWDLGTRKELRTLREHSDQVLYVAWRPDGSALASASADGTVRLWNLSSAQAFQTFEDAPLRRTQDNAENVAAALMMTSGAKLRDGQASPVKLVVWSLDGGMLASVSTDRTIAVRLLDGSEPRVLTSDKPVVGVRWSEDGKSLTSVSDDGNAFTWNIANSSSRALFRVPTNPTQVSWSSTGKTLAVGSAGGIIWLIDPKTGTSSYSLRGQATGVRALAWSPDGSTLASGSYDRTVRLWEAAGGQTVRKLAVPEDSRPGLKSVWGVAWNPRGDTLASAGNDRAVRLWEVSTGRALRVINGHKDLVSSVVWSPNGKLLASASWDRTVQLWDSASGEHLQTLTADQSAGDSIAWSPNGHVFAFVSGRTSVGFWSADWGRRIPPTLQSDQDIVHGIAWSPNGRLLASTGYDGTIRLWEAASWKLLRTLRGHRNGVRNVAWSPDGKWLASGGDDWTVRIWEAASGQALHLMEGQSGSVESVAWSPTGQTLAASSGNGHIQLWDPAHGTLLRNLTGHTDIVGKIAWSPDGKLLASASHDGTIRLWPGSVASLLDRARQSIRRYSPSAAECESYFGSAHCAPMR